MPTYSDVYYSLLGKKLNSQDPRHELPEEYIPFAENCNLGKYPEKRCGITDIYRFPNKFYGIYKYDSTYTLLINKNLMLLWNNSVTSPVYTAVTGAPTLFQVEDYWDFVHHFDSNYDPRADGSGGAMGTNGYVGNAGTAPTCDWLYSFNPYATPMFDDWGYGINVGGRNIISANGCLYIGDVAYLTGIYPYQIAHSTIDNAQNWTSYAFQTLPGKAEKIFRMAEWKNVILIFKFNENSGTTSIWGMTPYLNCEKMTDTMGLTDRYGLIVSDNVEFSHFRKVMDIQGNWLSYSIHNDFASTDPQGDLTAVEDPFLKKNLWCMNNTIFAFDNTNQTWMKWKFPYSTMRVWGFQNPFQRNTSEWVGTLGEHDNLSIAEEEVTPNYIVTYEYEDDKEAIAYMNPFCNDNGAAIDMIFETRWENLKGSQYANNRKRWIGIFLQGTPSTEFQIYAATSNYPTNDDPAYTYLGKLMTSSEGFGKIDFDMLGTFITLRVRQNSTSPARVMTLGYRFIPREAM